MCILIGDRTDHHLNLIHEITIFESGDLRLRDHGPKFNLDFLGQHVDVTMHLGDRNTMTFALSL